MFFHTHIHSLSPIFGTRFAQTNTALLGRGERRWGKGECFSSSAFSHLSPVWPFFFFNCNLVRGRRVCRKLKDTQKHVQRCLFPTVLSLLCSPGFNCSFFFCVCKDKIPYYMSWPYSQLLNSSLPLTLLGTVMCSVDCYCSDCDQGHLF